MIIQAVNVADVQRALDLVLRQWPGLLDMTRLTIQNGETPPDAASRCPWIGLYCVEHDLPIRTLGMGSGMRYQRMKFWAVCKEAHPSSALDCTTKLEALVQNVLSAVLSDPSIGNTVHAIEDLTVRYPEWGKAAGVHVQTAVVQFTAVTTVNAGG